MTSQGVWPLLASCNAWTVHKRPSSATAAAFVQLLHLSARCGYQHGGYRAARLPKADAAGAGEPPQESEFGSAGPSLGAADGDGHQPLRPCSFPVQSRHCWSPKRGTEQQLAVRDSGGRGRGASGGGGGGDAASRSGRTWELSSGVWEQSGSASEQGSRDRVQRGRVSEPGSRVWEQARWASASSADTLEEPVSYQEGGQLGGGGGQERLSSASNLRARSDQPSGESNRTLGIEADDLRTMFRQSQSIEGSREEEADIQRRGVKRSSGYAWGEVAQRSAASDQGYKSRTGKGINPSARAKGLDRQLQRVTSLGELVQFLREARASGPKLPTASLGLAATMAASFLKMSQQVGGGAAAAYSSERLDTAGGGAEAALANTRLALSDIATLLRRRLVNAAPAPRQLRGQRDQQAASACPPSGSDSVLQNLDALRRFSTACRDAQYRTEPEFQKASLAFIRYVVRQSALPGSSNGHSGTRGDGSLPDGLSEGLAESPSSLGTSGVSSSTLAPAVLAVLHLPGLWSARSLNVLRLLSLLVHDVAPIMEIPDLKQIAMLLQGCLWRRQYRERDADARAHPGAGSGVLMGRTRRIDELEGAAAALSERVAAWASSARLAACSLEPAALDGRPLGEAAAALIPAAMLGASACASSKGAGGDPVSHAVALAGWEAAQRAAQLMHDLARSTADRGNVAELTGGSGTDPGGRAKWSEDGRKSRQGKRKGLEGGSAAPGSLPQSSGSAAPGSAAPGSGSAPPASIATASSCLDERFRMPADGALCVLALAGTGLSPVALPEEVLYHSCLLPGKKLPGNVSPAGLVPPDAALLWLQAILGVGLMHRRLSPGLRGEERVRQIRMLRHLARWTLQGALSQLHDFPDRAIAGLAADGLATGQLLQPADVRRLHIGIAELALHRGVRLRPAVVLPLAMSSVRMVLGDLVGRDGLGLAWCWGDGPVPLQGGELVDGGSAVGDQLAELMRLGCLDKACALESRQASQAPAPATAYLFPPPPAPGLAPAASSVLTPAPPAPGLAPAASSVLTAAPGLAPAASSVLAPGPSAGAAPAPSAPCPDRSPVAALAPDMYHPSSGPIGTKVPDCLALAYLAAAAHALPHGAAVPGFPASLARLLTSRISATSGHQNLDPWCDSFVVARALQLSVRSGGMQAASPGFLEAVLVALRQGAELVMKPSEHGLVMGPTALPEMEPSAAAAAATAPDQKQRGQLSSHEATVVMQLLNTHVALAAAGKRLGAAAGPACLPLIAGEAEALWRLASGRLLTGIQRMEPAAAAHLARALSALGLFSALQELAGTLSHLVEATPEVDKMLKQAEHIRKVRRISKGDRDGGMDGGAELQIADTWGQGLLHDWPAVLEALQLTGLVGSAADVKVCETACCVAKDANLKHLEQAASCLKASGMEPPLRKRKELAAAIAAQVTY